jgi:hypothetical protein
MRNRPPLLTPQLPLLLMFEVTTIRREDRHPSTEAPEDNVRAMVGERDA